MIKTLRLAACVAAVLVLGAPGLAGAQTRGFTAQDMVSLDRLSDPRISPDGRHALYALRTVDDAANKAAMALWIVDLKARTAPRRLAISDGGASSGRWSADGRAIHFLSSRAGGVDQVFRTDLAGEVAVQVTAAPFDVGAFRVAPDGKTVVIAQAVFPDCPTLACTRERLAARKAAPATGVVHDRLFIRHWDTWADGTRNHLFALALGPDGVAAGPPTPLMAGFDGDSPTKPFGGDEDFSITPDGKTVTFAAKLAGRDEAWTTNYDIWAAPIDGAAAPVNLTAANLAWDTAPVHSPDGRWAAYRAMARPGFEADRFAIRLRDQTTGAVRDLAPDWDRSPGELKWSPDGKTLYAVAEDVGQTRLFAIAVASGKVTALTGPGHVGGFDIGPSGLVYAQDSLTGPAELFAADPRGGRPVKLVSPNADKVKTVAWGEAEQFEFKGWNDETVRGYLVKPAHFDPAKTYPVAFLIHGGPQGSFGNLFHYRWNAQTYAGAGYAVVMIDFHGSTGYGQAFTDAISQHWGDRPLEDLQKGWAFALAKYRFLDGGRACALGGSYGGFMVNWIAGQWKEPWKCLVNHDGVFDSRFMGYSTEELWFSEWENGGPPQAPGATYARFNPADHVAAWDRPMLVIHGGRDYRVPLEQGIAAFTALQRQGAPSKLLYFADENHWVLKPRNSVQWHDEVLGWLDRWTGNRRPAE